MITWILVGIAVLVIFGILEWRSWRKPSGPGLQNHWDLHNAGRNYDRPMTGGHDFKQRD